MTTDAKMGQLMLILAIFVSSASGYGDEASGEIALNYLIKRVQENIAEELRTSMQLGASSRRFARKKITPM